MSNGSNRPPHPPGAPDTPLAPEDGVTESSAVALERLRAILVAPDAAPGQKLPTERELAAKLGLGRREIRRALEVLEAEGLIWRRQGAGTFTGPPQNIAQVPDDDISASPAGLLNLIEARLALEPSLARLAAQRAAPEVMRRIATCIDRIDSAKDADSADLWDSTLHREIAQAAANPLLLVLYDRLNAWRHDKRLLRLRTSLNERHRVGASYPQTEHRRILAAMEAGDGAAAAQAMRDHLMDLHALLLRYNQEEMTGHDL
ncbi:FadR/GntR family transcriptional regulator [Halodurantibacterium flavum]|uniref:FadR/GntR family transcriptional regulator n=1 Tax=Halodurantibacterium flavum TaxID=1382802 RepID=A0ABW4S130_9RHOB